MNKELIAKVKFWFGSNHNIFKPSLIVERHGEFAYIYRKRR